MKKFLIILIIIFICGILSADICLKQMQESDIFLGLDFYKQYANSEFVFKNVFCNTLYERIKIYVLLILLCFTPIKEKIGGLLIIFFCFIWGFYLMSSIVALGIAGVVVGLASVLPHGIFYAGSLGALIADKRDRIYYRRSQGVIRFLIYIISLLLFLTACVIESLIGTHFIPWIIRIALI